MKEHVDIPLLGKYLSGNCTDSEKESVQNWIARSAENQVTFEEYKKVWLLSGMDESFPEINVDEGWNDLSKRITAAEALELTPPVHKQNTTRRFIYILTRVAAVLIIAFGFYYLFNSVSLVKTQNNTPGITYVAPEVSENAFTLADGSEIFLNKGAKITYPETFKGNIREVNFEGEAFFKVAHNPAKPFVIHCGEVEVEVLGTSFNLRARPDGNKVVLHLESGKVRFSSLDPKTGDVREQFIVLPGCKAVYNKTTGNISRHEFSGENYLAWKTGILSFEKTPLSTVFKVLEETYNIRIETDKPYQDLALTARFDNETPESIFEVLHTIFGVNYTINGQTVTIN